MTPAQFVHLRAEESVAPPSVPPVTAPDRQRVHVDPRSPVHGLRDDRCGSPEWSARTAAALAVEGATATGLTVLPQGLFAALLRFMTAPSVRRLQVCVPLLSPPPPQPGPGLVPRGGGGGGGSGGKVGGGDWGLGGRSQGCVRTADNRRRTGRGTPPPSLLHRFFFGGDGCWR